MTFPYPIFMKERYAYILRLPTSRKSAVVADSASAFVFYRSAAFRAGAHEHDDIVPVTVTLAAFGLVFFECPRNGVRTGHDPSSFIPCRRVARDAFELFCYLVRLDIRPECE